MRSAENDARFWDRSARKYAKGAIADQAGYERTLDRTRALLGLRDRVLELGRGSGAMALRLAGDRVLELGCGTGTTALRLAGDVQAYLATDISAEMIAIAGERLAADPVPTLAFRTATVEALAPDAPFDAVLGFNYLHLVRDLPDTLARIHALLAPEGLFISKTPCVGDMNPLLSLALPAMRAIGMAPYAGVFRAEDLRARVGAAGFDILADENHATKGDDHRPYIVARKR